MSQYPGQGAYIKVNQHCRDQRVMFFAGDVNGFFGWSFMDLIEHEYVEEVPKVNRTLVTPLSDFSLQ